MKKYKRNSVLISSLLFLLFLLNLSNAFSQYRSRNVRYNSDYSINQRVPYNTSSSKSRFHSDYEKTIRDLRVIGKVGNVFLSETILPIIEGVNAIKNRNKNNRYDYDINSSITVMVVPRIPNEENLCELSRSNKYSEAVDILSETLSDEKEIRVKNFFSATRSLKRKNLCSDQFEVTFDRLRKEFPANYYLIFEPNFNTSPTGNYVNISISIIDSKGVELEYFSSKSNKMASTNIALLSKQAFKKISSDVVDLMQSPDQAYAEIENEQINTNDDNNKDVKTNAILLNSDVDTNIPKTNRVNQDAVAVIIGNRSYQHGDTPDVDYAIHDSRIMKQYLIDMLGYREGNIIYVEDATQAKFNSIFGNEKDYKAQLFNYVKPGKSDVFIYYSGHGAPNPETNEGFFVPVDTDPSLIQYNGYSLKTFYTNLGNVPYRKLTVVIDACFSGASEGGMLLKNISPIFIKTENKILKDENAMVFTSASSEQVSSWYPEQNHSLFTYYFLKGLRGEADSDRNRKLSLLEMKDYLETNITYMARRLNNREQTPEIIGVLSKSFVE